MAIKRVTAGYAIMSGRTCKCAIVAAAPGRAASFRSKQPAYRPSTATYTLVSPAAGGDPCAPPVATTCFEGPFELCCVLDPVWLSSKALASSEAPPLPLERSTDAGKLAPWRCSQSGVPTATRRPPTVAAMPDPGSCKPSA